MHVAKTRCRAGSASAAAAASSLGSTQISSCYGSAMVQRRFHGRRGAGTALGFSVFPNFWPGRRPGSNEGAKVHLSSCSGLGPRREGPRLEGRRLEGRRLEGPRREGPRREGRRLEGPGRGSAPGRPREARRGPPADKGRARRPRRRAGGSQAAGAQVNIAGNNRAVEFDPPRRRYLTGVPFQGFSSRSNEKSAVKPTGQMKLHSALLTGGVRHLRRNSPANL